MDLRPSFLFLCLTASVASAQCTIGVQTGFSSIDCHQATAWYSVAGGTAPFSVTVTSAGGGLYSNTNSAANNTFSTSFVAYGYEVFVTDAQGCTGYAWTLFEPSHYQLDNHLFTWAVDCSSGTHTLRLEIHQGNSSCGAAELGSAEYVIFNTSVGGWPIQASGTLGNDWVLESFVQGLATWRFDGSLPVGSWAVELPFSSFPCPLGDVACVSRGCLVPPCAPTAFQGIGAGDCGMNFNMRAALAGALPNVGLMTDQLRSLGLLPTAEPYSGLGYSYIGSMPGTSIDPAVLTITGPDAIVDWLVLEVRAGTAPHNVLFSKPVLLQRDGDVVDTDGDPHVNCPLAPQPVRIALRHRNHLGVMTGTNVLLGEDPSAQLVDFRASGTSTYGTNARVFLNGSWCLPAGDVTRNGVVAYTGAGNDRDPILVTIGGSTPTATLAGQYRLEDVNLDGVVKYTGANNDRDIILQCIGGSTPTNTRTQQLP